MADYVSLDAPHRLRRRADPTEHGLTNPEAIPRAEHDRIAAIASHHRKRVGVDAASIVEMDAGEKAALAATAQTAADDAKMAEVRDYAYALKKQMRREINDIRRHVGMPNLTPGAFNAGIRARLEEL